MRLFSDYLHYTRATGAPCAAALLLAGCAEVTGGGYMRSADAPAAKANFALSLVCNENGYLVGHWVYHDKGPKVGSECTEGFRSHWPSPKVSHATHRLKSPVAVEVGWVCRTRARDHRNGVERPISR